MISPPYLTFSLSPSQRYTRKMVVLFVLLASLILNAAPADLSGTWIFSVDLDLRRVMAIPLLS